MIFTINTENNISAFASAKDIDNPETTQQFKTIKELNKLAIDWPSGRLVEIWNSLPGVQPVKKFRSRETAISRIWTAIQGLGATLPALAPAVPPVKASAKKVPPPTTSPLWPVKVHGKQSSSRCWKSPMVRPWPRSWRPLVGSPIAVP